MACYTMVTVDLPNTDLNRRARKKLGLPLEGRVTREQAKAVRIEAALLAAEDEILFVHPTAMITRDDNNELTVTLTV